MKLFRFGTPAWEEAVQRLTLRHEDGVPAEVEAAVRGVLADVRERGDRALLDYTERWDGVRLAPSEIRLPQARLEAAASTLPVETLHALELAHERIRRFHERQRTASWQYTDEEGNLLGQRVTPIDRVGVYVPGGKAAYPSSVLMNVVPARVAGVPEIVVVTPPGRIGDNPAILAAARLCGVTEVLQVGGAQAVAALAYGTESVPRVDKIVGPGNLYVATAKRLVFGTVDIDMVAGPSEVLVLTDGSAEPRQLAADLLAQAEHDENAVPLLACTSEAFAEAVREAVADLVGKGPWSEVASKAIAANGAVFLVPSISEGLSLVNRLAPEHLELAIEDAERHLDQVRHAGSIFLGHRSAEALGDYLAGPNHVLPTMGTARFFSPLGVEDFVKRSSVLRVSPEGLDRLGPAAAHLARTEGLHAHALALDLRKEA